MLATNATELRQDGGRQRGARDAMSDTELGDGSDEVLHALEELESVLRENAESERLLSKRIADVRLAHRTARNGRPSWATRRTQGPSSW